MLFPVVLKTRERYRRPGRLWYEVASNGLFQVREAQSYRAVTRVETGVPGLLPAVEEVVLRFPRVPARTLEEVLAFFHEAYLRYRGEAIVILFYRPGDARFCVRVPWQAIRGRRDWTGRFRAHHELRYRHVEAPAGFVRLGTIHSHANLPAYASAVDCADERYDDGLHVVFGDLDTSRPSRSASFVANATRFRLDPDTVLEPCAVPSRPARPGWMARLAIEEEGRDDRGSWETCVSTGSAEAREDP